MAKAKGKMTDDQVLDLLSPLMDRAKDHAEELSEDREKWLKWYRCEPYGNERPNWSQTVHPTIYSVMEWLKPGLVEVFTGDYFAFNPVVKSGEDKAIRKAQAEKLKRYVRHKLMTELEGEQIVEDALHDAMLGHFCVLKVTHRDDYDLVTEDVDIQGWTHAAALMEADPGVTDVQALEESPAMDAMGFPLSDPMTGEPVLDLSRARLTRKKIKYSGFFVEAVPPSELRYTPGYKTLGDCPLVAHVVHRDLDYIRRQERAGVYKKGSYGAVYDAVNSGDIDRAAEAEELTRHEYSTTAARDGDDYRDGPGRGLVDPNTRVQVWECYVKLDLDGSGLLKPCIVTVCGNVVLREPLENPYGGPPFEIGKIMGEPHRIEGRSFADVLNHRQRVASNLLRGIQDAAAMSTYRGFITQDARTRKALSELGPGDIALVPDIGRIQEVAPTPPPGFVLNAFELTLQEIAKESGVNENMQGLDNNSLNKTAAGMNMRMSAGMMRQKGMARRFARVWKRVLQRILDVIRLFPPKDDAMILGEDIQLSPEDYQAQYSVTIDVGVGPQDRAEKAGALGNLVALMMQMGGIIPPEKIFAAVRAQYEALDIDVEEFLPTPEELNTIQQLSAQNQQLQGQLQGMHQALDEHSAGMGAQQMQPQAAM